MKKQIENKGLNQIEKRAIEALTVAPVIRAVSQRIGREEALRFSLLFEFQMLHIKNGVSMFKELKGINSRPALFQFYTADELWANAHASQHMLAYHLKDGVLTSPIDLEFGGSFI